MAIAISTVNAFLDALDDVIQAIREERYDKANRHAEHACRCGQLLSIHPEFIKEFRVQCGTAEPSAAINDAVTLLMCIAAAQQNREAQKR